MAFPMRLREERTVHSGCATRDQVADRLNFWAARYGFTRNASGGDELVFRRGSHWSAFYTFDLRKVPTEVKVEISPSDVGLLTCRARCGSWFQASTRRDQKRLSELMDLLEACLKGALS